MADGRRGILTGGTWCVDRNKRVEFWPAEDGLAEILEEEAGGGGSACNLAIDVKKLDPAFPVATVGLIGDDADGALLLAQADAQRIDRSRLRVLPGARTQYTDAYATRGSGRRTHLFRRGTADLLTPAEFDFSTTRAALLHLGLPGVHAVMDAPWREHANGWVAVLAAARAAGLATNLELASLPPDRLAALVRPCLPHLDLLVVNDAEIGALAGRTTVADGTTDVAACIAAAAEVLERGAMALAVVHFPAGAVALARDGALTRQPSVRVPPTAIAGANGAGDAFAAGFLYGWLAGWETARALALGHAAAAASLRGMSTTGTVDRWPACLALAERWGWRGPL